MTSWFRARFDAFGRSYDHHTMMAGSAPGAIALVVGAMSAVFLVIGYAPAIAAHAQLSHPAIPLALTWAAGTSTYIAWKHECRGRIGTLGSLLDNPLYLAALVYAATHSTERFGMGIAAAYAITVLGATARLYSFSLLLALTQSLTPAVLISVAQPDPAISLILIASLVVALALTYIAGQRRRLLERQAQLERALGAADRFADESLQAALASMVLTLGDFLHELRNHQTAIAVNLAYLTEGVDLDPTAQEAIVDAKQAQVAERELVQKTIAGLQNLAKPVSTSFCLAGLVGEVVAKTPNAQFTTGAEADVTVTGNPEHLRSVLVNLFRNSTQAGAQRIQVELRVERDGHAAVLEVHDDGPGIPESRHARLFQPFTESTKNEGTGLGLYLCRRHVQLLGGTIGVGSSPLGGACFTITLPALPPNTQVHTPQ